jgi:hypothetical protein
MVRHPVVVVISRITYARNMKVDYSRFSWEGLNWKHVVATGKGKTGTIPAFAQGPKEIKKNLCRDGIKSNHSRKLKSKARPHCSC